MNVGNLVFSFPPIYLMETKDQRLRRELDNLFSRQPSPNDPYYHPAPGSHPGDPIPADNTPTTIGNSNVGGNGGINTTWIEPDESKWKNIGIAVGVAVILYVAMK